MAFEWLMGLLLLVGVAGAEPLQEGLIGYEQIDEDTLYVWNNGTIEPNYYYEGECMKQLSNMPNESWSLTDKYLGRINPTGEGYNLLLWGEQEECIRTDDSDFQTYANNTATNIIAWGQNSIELEMKSHLKLNDDKITQLYRFYSTRATNYDVWFMFNETNISVAGDKENDFLIVQNLDNETEYYNLSVVNQVFNSSEYYPFYFLYDNVENKNILNEWDNNEQEWFLDVNKDVKLYINLGEFERRETKYFTKNWIDAGCVCFGTGQMNADVNMTTDVRNFKAGDSFGMQCKFIISGRLTCSGCLGYWYDNSDLSHMIPTSASEGEPLECTGTGICEQKSVVYNVWYNKIITTTEPWTNIGIYCKHEVVGGLSPTYASGTLYSNITGRCGTKYWDYKGDWNIDEDVWCQDENFYPSGSININDSGSLTLNNTNITLNVTENVIIEWLSKLFIFKDSKINIGGT